MKRSPVRKKRPGPPRRGPAGVNPERWRCPEYLKFLREHGDCEPCLCVQLRMGLHYSGAPHNGDASHGPVNGMASKGPDAEAIFLCRDHHNQQHKIGWPAFEKLYNFNREKEAAKWWARYQETL